jgi:hypothetical protein
VVIVAPRSSSADVSENLSVMAAPAERRGSPDSFGEGASTHGAQGGLGRVGTWTFDFDGQPAGRVREAAAELEELGYGAIWYGRR